MQKIYMFILAVTLSGCMGYSPLYKQTAGAIDQVYVGDISMVSLGIRAGERRVAQLVHQQLRRSFHSKEQENYTLNARITETNVTLAVERDATDQRLQLNLIAEIVLRDAEGKAVFETSVKAAAPYNVEDSPFGTDAGREQARTSAARTLADEVAYRAIRFLQSAQKK